MTRTRVEMDPDDIDRFLGEGGTAVLALASADIPYAIPVSYAYDHGETAFYLRLADVDTGEKAGFVASGAAARLVAYARVDGTWKSVVADGTIAELPADALDDATVAAIAKGDVPLFTMASAGGAEPTYTIYRLSVDDLTGRQATPEGSGSQE